MGLHRSLAARSDARRPDSAWTLVGLDFPDATSSELVLSDHIRIAQFIEIEMQGR